MSILESIKEISGVGITNSTFDKDILQHINASLFILFQLGLINDVYTVNVNDAWDSIDINKKLIPTVENWMSLKITLIFDPPLSSTTVESYKSRIDELEWRLANSGL